MTRIRCAKTRVPWASPILTISALFALSLRLHLARGQQQPPTFDTAFLAQSSPLASASNTLTVTLQPNVDLGEGSRITLTGLTGTTTTETNLELQSDSASIQNVAQWAAESGTLTMVVASSGITAGTAVVFSFDVSNGAQEQTHRTVSVSAYGGVARPAIASLVMQSPDTELLGVQNGARPLKIVQPQLLVAAIGQDNPFASASNVISITIQPSTTLAPASVLTITGLSGLNPLDLDLDSPRQPCSLNTSTTTTPAPTTSSSTTAVPTTSSSTTTVPTTSSSTTAAATTTTSAATTATATATATTVSVTNSSNRTVCISANGTVNTTHIACNATANITTNCTIYCTLTTSTNFSNTTASSSRRAQRHLLQANASTSFLATTPAPPNACIESGFQYLRVLSTPRDVFFRGVQWDETGQKLLMYNAIQVEAEQSIVIRITVRNGDNPQASPTIHISGQIEAGRYDSPLSVETLAAPGISVLGVVGGGNALKVHTPDFSLLAVQQSNPWVSQDGTLTVSFRINCNLPIGSVVTLSSVDEMYSITREITIASESANGIPKPVNERSFSTPAIWNQDAGSITIVVHREVLGGMQYALVFNMRLSFSPRRVPWALDFGAVLESGAFDASLVRASVPVSQDVALASRPRDIVVTVDENGILRIAWRVPENTGFEGQVLELTGYRLQLLPSTGQVAIVTVQNSWTTSATLRDGVDGVSNQFNMYVGRSLRLSVAAVNSAGVGLAAVSRLFVGEVTCSSRCGDGRLDPDEGCDDGNVEVGDGCSEGCTVESDFVCEVQPAQYPCATAKFETSACHKPRFTAFKVTESTNLASTPNELVASIQVDATLPANSTIAITGLTGTVGPGDSLLPVSSIGEAVRARGEWLQTEGSLTLTTEKPLMANTVLVLSFTLANPAVSQPAVTPQIECIRCLFNPSVPILPLLSSHRVLGVTVEPPACAVPLYGSDCRLICYGILNGRFCDCPPGRFGDDCSQVATLDEQNSAPLTVVRAGQAGQVRAPSGAGVSIPAGATGEDVTISASAYNVKPKLNAEQNTLEAIGGVMDVKPEGLRFAREVELALTVDLFSFELAEAMGRSVGAFFLDPITRRWVRVGGALDQATGLLKVKTNHFSLWTVMSEPTEVTPPTTAVAQTVTTSTTPTPVVDTIEDPDSGVTRIDTTVLIIICAVCGIAFLFCGVAGAMGLKCFVPPRDSEPPETGVKSEFPVIFNPTTPGMGYEREVARSSPGMGYGREVARSSPGVGYERDFAQFGDAGRPPLPPGAQVSVGNHALSSAPMRPLHGQSSGPFLPPRGSLPPLPPPNPYVQLSGPAQIYPVATQSPPLPSLPPSESNTPRGSISVGADLLDQFHMQQLQNLTVPVLNGSAPYQLPSSYMPRGSAPPMLPTGRNSHYASYSNEDLYMTPPMRPPPPPPAWSQPMASHFHTSDGWPVRERVAVFENNASPHFDRIYQDVPYGFPGNGNPGQPQQPQLSTARKPTACLLVRSTDVSSIRVRLELLTGERHKPSAYAQLGGNNGRVVLAGCFARNAHLIRFVNQFRWVLVNTR